MRYAKDTLTLYYKQEKHTLTSDNEKIYRYNTGNSKIRDPCIRKQHGSNPNFKSVIRSA